MFDRRRGMSPRPTGPRDLEVRTVRKTTLLMVMILALSMTGCASTPPARRPDHTTSAAPAASYRKLVMAVRYEVVGLAAKRLEAASSDWTKRAFNASLALVDGTGGPRPYLAEALPQMDTDRWKVSPDGRMETTYRLRPNLTWQDGEP